MGFIKRTEDFVCENCGALVKGNGFTNHCPNCLFSKHVDKETPGDRKSSCLGLMEPVAVETKAGSFSVVHRCLKCGKTIKNKAGDKDNFEELLKLSQKG
ncbi:RNHCP domain-containing protein [Candidatus Microgenomates bacterium]|jgi:hypothetical protein|nr:MAG: RNHCP domain-containing protein [Candidatus Microgenomates bacterium]